MCVNYMENWTSFMQRSCCCQSFFPGTVPCDNASFPRYLNQSCVRVTLFLFVVFCLPKPLKFCLFACLPCRRELSYFGVKVAVIEPGYFKTAMTNYDRLFRCLQEAWELTSSEVKDLYGEEFLASCE